MTSQLTIPFEISDDKKIKQMIRTLKVAKANLATSKMNIDFYLRILKKEASENPKTSLGAAFLQG
tara:strand:+ start:294 stop:488 length:195 start_codon:yes stop_codon:yes gene_type:complete